MNTEWQSKIIYRPEIMGYAVYLYRKVDGAYDHKIKGGEAVVTSRHGEVVDDPIYLVVEDPSELNALALAIAENGYKAPDQHLVEGKLIATQNHLEDMRKLLFHKEKITVAGEKE